MESEPPYQYVRGNPTNWLDPFGREPERDKVGTEYVYSCNCGWIDWNHAVVRGQGLIEAIEERQTGTWGWDSLSTHSSEARTFGPIQFSSFTAGEVLVSTNLSSELEIYRVALGIFVSAENLFEAHQGGEFIAPRAWVAEFRTHPSTFSEEDLMSNLIGFHRGLMARRGVGEDQSEKEIEKMCGVVGLELKESGRMEQFVEKQQQIYDQYPTFQKVFEWGNPRLGAWQGSIEVNCMTVDCKKPKVPSGLLWLEPEPPFPYQSTKPTWTWISATAHFAVPFMRQSVDVPAGKLNQMSLNWLSCHSWSAQHIQVCGD